MPDNVRVLIVPWKRLTFSFGKVRWASVVDTPPARADWQINNASRSRLPNQQFYMQMGAEPQMWACRHQAWGGLDTCIANLDSEGRHANSCTHEDVVTQGHNRLKNFTVTFRTNAALLSTLSSVQVYKSWKTGCMTPPHIAFTQLTSTF